MKDARNRFDQPAIFEIADDGFDKLIKDVYGHYVDVNVEEEHLYESTIEFDVEAEEGDEEMDTFKKHGVYEEDNRTCKSEGVYPGTQALFNDMCHKGLIDPGTYQIYYNS